LGRSEAVRKKVKIDLPQKGQSLLGKKTWRGGEKNFEKKNRHSGKV